MNSTKPWKGKLGIILLVAVLVLSVLFVQGPFYYQVRSYIVMYAYSKYEERNSILSDQDIQLKIPGGSSTEERDWYPFVMVFNDDQGFSNHMGRDLSLTVLYNFGAFGWDMSTSDYFLEESPYYNSFYGGYLVQDHSESKKYGFDDQGNLDVSEVLAVPEYDYKHLVMEGFGCPEQILTMNALSYNQQGQIPYAGYDGWFRIDALMLVNRPNHQFQGNRRSYIQYGKPLIKSDQEEFGLMTTNGRIYVRYFEELESTVFLYILSPSAQTVEECDQKILSKAIIS